MMRADSLRLLDRIGVLLDALQQSPLTSRLILDYFQELRKPLLSPNVPLLFPYPRSSVSTRGLLFFLATALTAVAQPAPKLTTISPEWIQRGTTLDVTLTGENLGDVTQILFNGDAGLTATNPPPAAPARVKPSVMIESTGGGISLTEPAAPKRDEKKLVLKVTALADASLSPRELRVIAPGGVSNPLNLNVGQWPEVAKRDPNTSLADAQPVELPAVISGVLNTAAQTNHFRFKAKKGEDFVFEVDAARRGLALDSSLSVLDPTGKELARNEDAIGLDSLLFFTAPSDGEFIVALRDFRFRGGNEYSYRLIAGPIPYVESLFPFGGQRGKSVEVTVTGRNLDGTTKLTLDIAPKAPRSQEIRVKTPRGYSNLVPFNVSDLNEIIEGEPNNALTNAQTVTAPLVINGRMGEAGDIDRFRFKSASDQKLVCEIAAGRFGSKLDALLILTDTNGTLVVQNDDANGADARIEFDAKKDTEYLLAARDLTDRGGDRFGYRLSIRPPSAAAGASFAARFLPDTLRVNRDGSTRLRCEVTRNGGFDGPVRFAFAELPSGAFAEPLVVPNGPSSGIMTVSASKNAPVGSFPVRLTASGAIGGKTVTLNAEPLNGERGVRQAYLTVLETAPFHVDLASLTTTVEQGQSTTLEVVAERSEGFAGDIKVVAEGFSAGRDALGKSFEGGEILIKAAETMGRITLKPRMNSETGTRTVVLRGEATVNGQLVTQYSQPIPVSVTEFPLPLSSTLPRLALAVLPPGSASAAGEAMTTIKATRRAGFSGDIELALEGLPAGVKSELAKMPASIAETPLKLNAMEKAVMGTNYTLTVVGSFVFNDRNYKARTGPIALSISPPEQVEVATNAPPAAVIK